MRIILKPVGVLFILGGFLLLIFVAFGRNRVQTGSVPPSQGLDVGMARGVASKAPAVTPSVKVALPPGVLLMPDIASPEWQWLITPATNGAPGAVADHSVVDAPVPGHSRARRINISAISANPWEIQLARPLSVPLTKGKRIRLTFWGRSENSCPVTAVVEQNTAPYTKVIYKEEVLTPEWKQYTEEWTQASDTPANWAKMDFHLGHKVGEVELTGVIIRQVSGGK